MRQLLVLAAVVTVGGIGVSAEGHAAAPLPSPGGQSTPASLAQRVQYYPPNAYRPYGYYVPAPPGAVINQAPIADGTYVPPPPVMPVAPVAPAVVPAAPAVVVTAPVIVVPPRPASCGEFRFWNGFACVDARFNQPYVGPRP